MVSSSSRIVTSGKKKEARPKRLPKVNKEERECGGGIQLKSNSLRALCRWPFASKGSLSSLYFKT